MRACGIVTLTTDFGLDDAYVAQLHGALLGVNPRLRIVDVSHTVPPGDATTALFPSECAWPAFPVGAVHVLVVDPGVGSDRGLVAIETAQAWLVGPDTGVLSSGLPASMRPAAGFARATLPAGLRAADIRETPLAAPEVSRTFHGRDLMAPVAAALASGRGLELVGRAVSEVTVAAPLASPLVDGEGEGRILHVDRFGNAITSFRASDAGAAFEVEAGGRTVAGPAASYAAGGTEVVALPSSSGYVELALANGSAAEALGVGRGDPVRLRRRNSGG